MCMSDLKGQPCDRVNLSELIEEIALTTDFDNKERIVQLASQARSGWGRGVGQR